MKRGRRSPLSNIMGKEIRELLTLATIVPIIAIAIVFASMGGMIGGAQEEAEREPVIGLINLDTSSFNMGNTSIAWGATAAEIIDLNADVKYNGTDVNEGLKVVSDKGGVALLVITPNFGENINRSLGGSVDDSVPGTIEVYWIMQGAGIMDSISSSVVDALIAHTNKELSKAMIFFSGNTTDPDFVLSPTVKSETTYFKEKTMEGISPPTIAETLSTQSFIVPMVVMIVVMMSGSMVIASMGMEKENKTLETLMTMPVKRRDIVLGKLGGAAVVGLIMALVYMLGMNQYMTSMEGSSSIDLAKYGLVLDAMDYVLVGITLFLAVLGALTLCMLLGAMARDYKSAQSLTLPVSLLAMIPFFILMMKDFNTLPAAIQGALFLIPFTHPMMAMNNLMFDDYNLVLAGIAYELVFVVATMALVIWIFKKDMLVSGRQRRTKGKKGTWPGIKLGEKKEESVDRKEGTPLWKDLGK